MEHQHVRAGDGAQDAAVDPGDPRHRPAVVEADDQLGTHRHAAAETRHLANHVGVRAPERHEVREQNRPVRRLEPRVQHERVAAVGAAGFDGIADGRDQPSSVLGSAEQGGKTGRAVEARPAEPVDRPVAADERGGFAVADQGIVFDARRQYDVLVPRSQRSATEPTAYLRDTQEPTNGGARRCGRGAWRFRGRRKRCWPSRCWPAAPPRSAAPC